MFFLNVFELVSHAHKGCIYLIKKDIKNSSILKYYNLK